MNTSFRKILLVVGMILCWTQVWAEEYKELSYDELLNELSSKTKKSQRFSGSESLDAIKIHIGLGAITSAGKVRVADKNLTKESSGFQLSVGLDLFSANWAAEAVIRNFGQSQSASEIRSLREYDLNVIFKDRLENSVGYRLGVGLGTRYLRISDERHNIFIDNSTPTGVLFVGTEAFVTDYLSLIFDLGTRTALISNTVDKNSIDLSLGLVTNF